MRRLAVVVVMVCVGAVAAGCGGSDDSAPPVGPTTPTDLVAALNQHAYMGEVDEVLALLSEDALSQRGRQWVDFIGRIGHPKAVAAIQGLSNEERRAMDGKLTSDFLAALKEKSPRGFAKMFSVYIEFDYEEKGRILVWSTSSSLGYSVFLALERQEDQSLKLLGEKELKKVHRALLGKLQKAYSQRGQ